MANSGLDDFEAWRASTGAPGARRCARHAGARQRQPPACPAGTTRWTGGRNWPRARARRRAGHGATRRSIASTAQAQRLVRADAAAGRAVRRPGRQRAPTSRRPGSRRSAATAPIRSPTCSAHARAGPARRSTQWIEQMRAVAADRMQARQARSWLGLPAFGFAREHQERWQQLAQAQLDYQQQSQRLQRADGRSRAARITPFRGQAGRTQRAGPAARIGARAVRPVDRCGRGGLCGHRAVAATSARSTARCQRADARARAACSARSSRSAAQLGMPTRTEIDAAHRKIVQLERELRRLRDALQAARRRTARRPT